MFIIETALFVFPLVVLSSAKFRGHGPMLLWAAVIGTLLKIALAEEVIRHADALGDPRLAFTSRLLATNAYTYGGEPAKAFVTFAWASLSHVTGFVGPAQASEASLHWVADAITLFDPPGALGAPQRFAAGQIQGAAHTARDVHGVPERIAVDFVDWLGHDARHRGRKTISHDDGITTPLAKRTTRGVNRSETLVATKKVIE